jgi:tetratricopeptide (TPR) repeat protein
VYKNYANGDWTVPSVAFPQFVSNNWGIPQNLYSWTSGGMWNHRLAHGDPDSVQGTVDPLVLSDPGYRTVILSAFSNYLVVTQQSGPLPRGNEISRGAISCGIEGLVQEIPAGYEHKHIMVVGQGIHNTFQEWGRTLLARAGKKIPSKYQDDTLKYLVYMDDAGAYYYEHDFKEPGYNTYADIILGIEKEAKDHSLRIGSYHILDDPQQRDREEGLFEPRTDLFPEGLAKFHERLGKPLELYYMWIRSNSPYRKKYAFYDVGGEVPGSMGDVFYSAEYWQDTADRLASWGTILLQHDYLSDYEGDRVMMSGIGKMDTYFKNMARALQAKGIDIQYFMQLPRNVMESTENPVMVSLQATDDHHVPMAESHKEPIRLRPGFAEGHNNLGLALLDDGNCAQSIAEFREALRLEPNNAAAHYNLGLALRQKGEAGAARAEFQRAEDLDPLPSAPAVTGLAVGKNLGASSALRHPLPITELRVAHELNPQLVDQALNPRAGVGHGFGGAQASRAHQLDVLGLKMHERIILHRRQPRVADQQIDTGLKPSQHLFQGFLLILRRRGIDAEVIQFAFAEQAGNGEPVLLSEALHDGPVVLVVGHNVVRIEVADPHALPLRQLDLRTEFLFHLGHIGMVPPEVPRRLPQKAVFVHQ